VGVARDDEERRAALGLVALLRGVLTVLLHPFLRLTLTRASAISSQVVLFPPATLSFLVALGLLDQVSPAAAGIGAAVLLGRCGRGQQDDDREREECRPRGYFPRASRSSQSMTAPGSSPSRFDGVGGRAFAASGFGADVAAGVPPPASTLGGGFETRRGGG
jgi:hypothetical protein